MKGISFLCLALAVFAPLDAAGGDLSGQVTRAGSGEAVASAQVLIRGTSFSTTTDANGQYLFADLPNGSYGLTCAAPGLRGSSSGAVWIGDETVRDFSLSAPEDIGTIQGVATCAANPCAGVVLFARQGGSTKGIGLSAANGGFDIVGLAAGDYDLRAEAYGYLPASVSMTLPAPATDGGTSVVNQNINLAAGGGPYSLSGVAALSDNPLDRTGATVRCNGQIPTLSTLSQQGGSYRLDGLPAGPLSFSAFKTGYRSDTQIDVMITGDRNLNFVLVFEDTDPGDPSYRISGRVQLEIPDGGSPVDADGSHVSIWSDDEKYRRQTSTNADGEYSISGIPAGSYLAGASREGFTTQLQEAFELTDNRTFNFSLPFDPDYQWGPGADGNPSGCSCNQCHPEFGGLLLLLLAWAIRQWIR